MMDGNSSAYYNRPAAYFASDQFARAPITVGGSDGSPGNYSPPPPPACIYAEKAAAAAAAAHQNGYGGSPMAVVESARLEDVGLAAQYPRMHSNVNMMALANMTLPQEGNTGSICSPSCAQVSAAVSMPQCGSAGVAVSPGMVSGAGLPHHSHSRHLHHQQQNLTHHLNGSSVCSGQDVKPKMEDNEGKNLPFPWMKTTKSHAHMWKANWPGNAICHIHTPKFMTYMYTYIPSDYLKVLLKNIPTFS